MHSPWSFLFEESSFSHWICQPQSEPSFSSRSNFKTIVLKVLSSKCDLWASRGTFSVDLFYSFEWVILFCSFVYLVIFLVVVENSVLELYSTVSSGNQAFPLFRVVFLIVLACLWISLWWMLKLFSALFWLCISLGRIRGILSSPIYQFFFPVSRKNQGLSLSPLEATRASGG